MKRRNFIAGLGALSAGGAAALGTGAFSSVEAERDVSVELADDANAYLALEATSDYAEANEDGMLELDFGDLEDHGDGVGEDSSYIFGSGNPERNVFTVENQGTQDVNVTPDQQLIAFDEDGNIIQDDNNNNPDPDEDDLELVDGAELSIFISNFDLGQPTVLGPGDSIGYYIVIGTGDNPPEDVTATFEINANEDED